MKLRCSIKAIMTERYGLPTVADWEDYLNRHPSVKAELTWGVEKPGRLTGRERLVLRLRTEWWTQKQVGENPRIMRSRSTVGRIEKTALSKLGIDNISRFKRPTEPPIKLFP